MIWVAKMNRDQQKAMFAKSKLTTPEKVLAIRFITNVAKNKSVPTKTVFDSGAKIGLNKKDVKDIIKQKRGIDAV